MSERSFFFNSLNGDRTYGADDFVSYFKELITNGVFKDVDLLNLKVQAYSGMKVRINKGAAIIDGYKYYNDASLDLTVEASDPINPRIDLVVVRLDIANRTSNAVIKKGTPGSVPEKPTLITDSVVEIPLASIRVNKGVVSITNSNITDERVFAHSYLDVNHVHNLSDIDDISSLGSESRPFNELYLTEQDTVDTIKLLGGWYLISGTISGMITSTYHKFNLKFPFLVRKHFRSPILTLQDCKSNTAISVNNVNSTGFDIECYGATVIGAIRVNYWAFVKK